MKNLLFYVCVFALAQIVSVTAFAESASITMQTLKSLHEAQEQSKKTCENINRDPRCAANLNALQRIGLSVPGCLAQKNAAHCESFFREYPQFKQNELRCEPKEICKLALTSTLGEGCKRYGIEFKNGFVGFLNGIGACSSNFDCSSQKLFSALVALSDPGAAARLGAKLGAALVKDVKKNVSEIQNMACLDAETQSQYACAMAVEIGAAVIMPEAAALGKTIVTKMAKLEGEMLVRETEIAAQGLKSEVSYVERGATQTQAPPPPEAPYVSLGLFSETADEGITAMDDFVGLMNKRFKHDVVHFWDFDKAPGYAATKDEMWKVRVIPSVKKAITTAIERAPGRRMVLFKLDGIDIERALKFHFDQYGNMTSTEMKLILKNRKFFDATAWFLNGRELNAAEVLKLFGKYIPR